MKKVFVINFDEAIIFETEKDNSFYNEQYDTFEEAKVELVCYLDNLLSDIKYKINSTKNMKLYDVKTFSK